MEPSNEQNQTPQPQQPTSTPTPVPTPLPTPGAVPPGAAYTPSPVMGASPKSSKKKVFLIIAAVFVGLIGLLAMVPTPPEEPKPQPLLATQVVEPEGTRVERFDAQKFSIAVPKEWLKETDFKLQNVDSKEETQKELKDKLAVIFYDDKYEASEESPTLTVQVKKHNYVSDESAVGKLYDIENQFSEMNGHAVSVKKEEVKVGKTGKFSGYLYSYEDTFEKDSVEKIKNYRLIFAANGNYYYIYGSYSAQFPDKYDAMVRASVLSVNPDES